MQTVESSVVAVTVYRTGALVTREATVARGAGGYPRRVQLVGLPLTLDDASIRVEVDAEAGTAPIAGDVRVTVAVPGTDEGLPPPEDDELEEARLQHTTAARALKDLRAALQRLALLQVGDRGAPEEGHPPARSPTDARMHLLELRRRRESVLHDRIADALDHAQDAKQHLDTLLERRRVASDSRNTRTFELRKAAVIALVDDDHGGDASSAAQARVRVRYFVTGARWAPAYTVRLDGTMTDGTLHVRAVVGQRTGEDWRNVALTLSTARPQHWTELPEVKAIRIGRAQPAPRTTGWRPPPTGAEALYADYDHGLPKPPPQPPPQPRPAPQGAAAPAEEDALDGVMDDAPGQSQVMRARAAKTKKRAPQPPPPPASAPAPAQVSLHRSEPRSGGAPVAEAAAMVPVVTRSAQAKGAGLSNLVGGVLGGAAAGVAAVFGAGDAGDIDEYGSGAPEQPAELVAGRDLLDYGALQLHRADHGQRGRLRRVETRVLYERWAVEEITTDVIFQRLSAAQGAARTLEHAAPPPGHHWPDDDSGFDYAYVADAPVDVASDGKLTSLAIAVHATTPTPRYVSVPRETQDVFRIVAVRSPIDAPLLPGPVDVYVAGKFALTSTMSLTPPRGRFELGLGVEQAIKIARNVAFEEDTSGLIKRTHELIHTIKIDVTNNLPAAAVVEIRERVPVTPKDSDDLEVEVGDVRPPWEEYEQREPWPIKGGRIWKIELEAGGRRTLSATWLARIPSQHELIGGNRRES